MKKKLISIIVAGLMMTTSLLTGCSVDSSSNDKAASNKPVEITFWHSMGGKNGEAITKMVKDFNASHKNIKVNAQFQGKYDDAINKLKSAEKGSGAPDVMQVYEIGRAHV